MKRALCIAIWLFCISRFAAAEQVRLRVVHFPKEQAVGSLKIRDVSSDDYSDRGLLSRAGWALLGQAQGDIQVPTGRDLRLEVYREATDFSFLANLKPNDLQVLYLSLGQVFDEDLVHVKGLSRLLGLHLGSTAIEGTGLVHLATLTSLRNLSLYNTQVSDAGLVHLSGLRSLKDLTLHRTQVKGSGLKHLKNLTSLVYLGLGTTSVTDESLVHLADMTWLKELELYDTDIGDKGLAHLKSLCSLEKLVLGKLGSRHEYSPITDKGLVHINELTSLKDLRLYRTRITDAGLAHLANLEMLETLLLTGTQITGEGLAFLKYLPALRDLSLNQTGVNDAGLANCKVWSNTLEGLGLDGTKISDGDLAHLAELKALRFLTLSNTPITDAGLVQLSKLKSLESLRLDNTRITDAGLLRLKDLPNLHGISLTGTKVTRTGVEKFKQISASKSIKVNVSKRLVIKKEQGTVIVEKEQLQPEGQAPSLVGKPVPDLDGIKIDIPLEDAKIKNLLVCFWDMNQRPSRNCIMRLAKQAEQLKQKGVTVVAVQASKIDENALNEWIKNNNIPFTAVMVQGDVEKTKFTWGVRSLPWLILTDQQHIIRKEGFSLPELNEKINTITQK